MNEQNNNSGSNNTGNNTQPEKKGGWSHPWGYNIPCFREADKTDGHQCPADKQYGNFLVNEKASHFE
ncbi:MAG: hypothetical protein K2Y22_14460 [Candidatus Obscuribacterales bacterium]|nr:hypothetical protein [Candidatus Obscuribacterales bacterium]